jgi:hypothetical protein
MAKKTVEVTCKKCLGAKYIGKGKKQPCPKCIDPETNLPTGKFKKEIEDGPSIRP